MLRSIARHPDAAVLAFGALMVLPFLGSVGLFDPWETHYAEVARAMIARNDFVYPYWSTAHFFSKPVLTPWLIAIGLLAAGAEPADPSAALGSWVEWGVRLPFGLLAIATLWGLYRLGAAISDRRTGLWAAFILGTSPMFVLIAKQAITDLPAVALMVLGLAFFVPVLESAEGTSPPSPRGIRLAAAILLLASTWPQLALIGRAMTTPLAEVSVLGLALAAAAVAFRAWRSPVPSTAPLVLAGAFFGLSALAKGLATAAVVAPAFVLAVISSRDLGLLRRARLHLVLAIALLVAVPWYATLAGFEGRDDEGLTFVSRFFLHDHFSRLGSGVHGDRGGAGYYAEQVLYGFFPWSALLPGAVLAVAFDAKRSWIMVLLLGVWSCALFTLSQTKFHHYILPALPPFALLVARAIQTHGARQLRPGLVLLALAIYGIALRDLLDEPQRLVGLFTYKYDREFPREVSVRPFLVALAGGGGLLSLAACVRKKGRLALGAFASTAALLAIWLSHHHFNMLSPHWSQAHLLETYFRQRAAGEPLIAFQLNWRGETFYSRNNALQISNAGAAERLRQLVSGPGRAFIIVESSRLAELRGALPPETRGRLEILDRSNVHFYLCVVEAG
ncbi:MAG: glycosyltransferase family 39 protein [Deltaproteobacteria bacterium]|nr:glycosyltransferase family 39 protein [Deltaproteobacteria bacterium]